MSYSRSSRLLRSVWRSSMHQSRCLMSSASSSFSVWSMVSMDAMTSSKWPVAAEGVHRARVVRRLEGRAGVVRGQDLERLVDARELLRAQAAALVPGVALVLARGARDLEELLVLLQLRLRRLEELLVLRKLGRLLRLLRGLVGHHALEGLHLGGLLLDDLLEALLRVGLLLVRQEESNAQKGFEEESFCALDSSWLAFS